MRFGHNPYPLEKMGLCSSCQRYLASRSWWRLIHKTAIQHVFYPFKDITEGFEDDDSYDLMIVDTPASVEDNSRGLRAMVDAADFVLLPTGASGEDMDSLKETLDALRATSARRHRPECCQAQTD
jgi:cellulose biosynthesis protein BcsQ